MNPQNTTTMDVTDKKTAENPSQYLRKLSDSPLQYKS